MFLSHALPFSLLYQSHQHTRGRPASVVRPKATYSLTRVMTSLGPTTRAGRSTCHPRLWPQRAAGSAGNVCLPYSPHLPHRSTLILEEAVRDHVKILPHMHWVHRPSETVLVLFKELTGENYASRLRMPRSHDWNGLHVTSFIQFMAPHSLQN